MIVRIKIMGDLNDYIDKCWLYIASVVCVGVA